MSMTTILYVEDEPMVREIMTMELEDAGFHVREAADGRETVALIEAGERFDALVTDGLAVAEAARRAHPAVPVLYASGFAPDPLRIVPGGRLFAKPMAVATVVGALCDLGVVASR